MELKFNKLSIHDKVKIMGHRFNGLKDIKAAVELSSSDKDMNWFLRAHANKDYTKLKDIHVAEIWASYPCFDSSDSLYENRTYQNYFFSREPFTEKRLREIFESCRIEMNFRLINDDMPAWAAPALYYEGDGDEMVLAISMNRENEKPVSVFQKIISRLKKIFCQSRQNG
ncbi:MAG: hypothetical protein K2L14_03560 [Duncaniella sp.]|nr:hypothetical protein [Duncaniella sp.]